MLYRHTARFQILMQAALRIQCQEPIISEQQQGKRIKYSDEALAAELQLNVSRQTLQRFRKAAFPAFDDETLEYEEAGALRGSLKRKKDAQRLWDYLSKNGFVERAIPGGTAKLNKKHLASLREVANVLMCFFDVNESRTVEFSERGLGRVDLGHGLKGSEWFCFKKSFRKPGFVVKSKFHFANFRDEYFEVVDDQQSTGRFERTPQKFFESSSGIAFSKSDKLWCFLRERQHDQPRIFCFYSYPVEKDEKPEKFGVSQDKDSVSIIYGHVMEADKRWDNGFQKSNVILCSEEMDKKLWRQKFRNRPYVSKVQHDIFPISKRAIEDWQEDQDYYVPEFIVSYLNTGHIP